MSSPDIMLNKIFLSALIVLLFLVVIPSADTLFQALDNDDLPGVIAQLKAGVDPNTSDPSAKHHTALMVASEHGSLVIAEQLIKAGANVNTVDDEKNTSLMMAAEGGHASVAKLLMSKGANVNAADDYGFTALHRAACEFDSGTLQVLVEGGANVNMAGQFGYAVDNAARLLANGQRYGISQPDRQGASQAADAGEQDRTRHGRHRLPQHDHRTAEHLRHQPTLRQQLPGVDQTRGLDLCAYLRQLWLLTDPHNHVVGRYASPPVSRVAVLERPL